MIDKKLLLSKIAGSKETKDYTYAILFLLISSFFAFVVVRPVLSIAVSLNKEVKELKEVNSVFEKNISNMVGLQSQMQEIRSQLYLVDIALPKEPSIQSLMQDIRQIAVEEGMQIETIEVSQSNDDKKVNTPTQKDKNAKNQGSVKPITIKLVVRSDFDQAIKFIRKIVNQKRLKTIDRLNLMKNKDNKTDEFLTIDIEVVGYHM